MDLSNVKKITIDAGEVKQIEINGVIVWKGGYTNLIPTSIDTKGNIYNGMGYKDGYRIRSSGAEAEIADGACTGYIKVNGGDVVRVTGCDVTKAYNTNAINVYDGSFNNLGQIVANYKSAGYGIFATSGAYVAYCWDSGKIENGVYEWTVPPSESGIAYIRVTGYIGTSTGGNMIITVNEKIEE